MTEVRRKKVDFHFSVSFSESMGILTALRA